LILVFDSYAWIEYFAGTEKGIIVKDLIEKADIIYTPTVVLLEIANKYSRDGFSQNIISERLRIIREISIIDRIRDEVLLLLREAQIALNENARRLNLKKKPSMIDYYIYALAKNLNARVVTGDQHFKGLNITIYLE